MEKLAEKLKMRYRELVSIHFAKDLYNELCQIISDLEKDGQIIHEFAVDVVAASNNICKLRLLIADTILTHCKE